MKNGSMASLSFTLLSSDLRSMKQERRRAERHWLSTGSTVNKEITNSIKHQISFLVSNEKSTFYSVKISTSSTVKEFYNVANNLLGEITSTALPSDQLPSDHLPQVFSDFVVSKARQIRDSIDIQVVHNLSDRHFSGTPLCGFERVTNETVEVHETNVS